jgi:hypothetical protein
MSGRKLTKTVELSKFVDALREFLGLDPLYNDHTDLTDMQRFYRVYSEGKSGQVHKNKPMV